MTAARSKGTLQTVLMADVPLLDPPRPAATVREAEQRLSSALDKVLAEDVLAAMELYGCAVLSAYETLCQAIASQKVPYVAERLVDAVKPPTGAPALRLREADALALTRIARWAAEQQRRAAGLRRGR